MKKTINTVLSDTRPVAAFNKEVNLALFTVCRDEYNARKGVINYVTPDNELNFYKVYLRLLGVQIDAENEISAKNNVSFSRDKITPLYSLPEGDLEYVAYLMAKPMTHTFSYSQKSDEFSIWGRDLGKTSISAKNAFSRLRKAQYVYKTEDKIWALSEELQRVRKRVKDDIKNQGYCHFTYLFSSVIIK